MLSLDSFRMSRLEELTARVLVTEAFKDALRVQMEILEAEIEDNESPYVKNFLLRELIRVVNESLRAGRISNALTRELIRMHDE